MIMIGWWFWGDLTWECSPCRRRPAGPSSPPSTAAASPGSSRCSGSDFDYHQNNNNNMCKVSTLLIYLSSCQSKNRLSFILCTDRFANFKEVMTIYKSLKISIIPIVDKRINGYLEASLAAGDHIELIISQLQSLVNPHLCWKRWSTHNSPRDIIWCPNWHPTHDKTRKPLCSYNTRFKTLDH